MCFTPAQLAVASDLPPAIEVRIPDGNAEGAAPITQEAVDSAASSHTTVMLPAGRYRGLRKLILAPWFVQTW
jgi:hypothetical protein